MGRKVVLAYTVFSILALVVLVVWTTYSLLETRTQNLSRAGGSFERLTQRVASAYNDSEGFDSPSFRSFTRSLFLADPRLQVLLIRSREGGVRYLFARHTSYVQNPQSAGGSWHGSILYNTVTEALFSSPLTLSNHPSTRLSAVYTIFDRESLDAILRPFLTVVIGFLLLTGIMIALRSIRQGGRRASPSLPPSGEPLPAGSPSARPTEQVAHPTEEALSRTAQAEGGSVAGEEPSGARPALDPRMGDEKMTLVTPSEAPTETVAKWVPLSEEIVPLEPEPAAPSSPSASQAESPGRPFELAASPAARAVSTPRNDGSKAPELDSRSETPILERPLPESTIGAAAAAIEHPSKPEISIPSEADERAEAPPSSGHQPSAEDELADIEDFEDLETIDGSAPSTEETASRPSRAATRASAPPRTVPPQPPAEEFGELEEVTDDLVVPVSKPPVSLPGRQTGTGGASSGGGLLRRLLAQEAAEGEGQEEASRSGSGARASSGRGAVHTLTPGGADSPRGLFSPQTGLGWPEYFEKRLSFEIDRCASFDQDLSLALMRCRASIDGEARREIAGRILAGLSFQDLCFEYADGGFAVILPNLDLEEALEKLELFQSRLAEEERFASLRIGVAARDGRLLSGAQLIAEADRALARAAASPTERVVPTRAEHDSLRGDSGS